MMEKSGKIRLDYLDYARAVGIMLIVMQHAFQYFYVYNGIVSYIKAFHVTIFFVISGYLTGVRDSKDYRIRELILARVKSLFIPYVVFSLINTFLKFTVLGIQGELTAEIIKQEMLELFVTGNGTVWFLTTLFGVEILFYFFKERYGNIFYALTGIILGSIPFFIQQRISPVEILLKRIMVGYAFFVWGYFLARYLLNKLRYSMTGSIILIAAGAIAWKNQTCEMNYFNGEFRGIVAALFINITSVTGILLLMYCLDVKTERKWKVLSYIGRNSLIIMVVHPILLMCYIYPLGGKIAEFSEKKQWIAGIVLYLSLIILEVPAIELIRKHFPFMIGKKKALKI